MPQYRFVGNIPVYIGDLKISKLGEKVQFSETQILEINQGGGTFITEAEFVSVFGKDNPDVEKYGGNPALRACAPPTFLDKINRAQQIFRDNTLQDKPDHN